jgi:hypothetical protein
MDKKPKSKKNKPKITDWIQAIAAAISIPAAIFGFFTFFQKDVNLQRQISNLDTISRQSIIQTEILTKQIEILKEEQVFLKEQNDLSNSHRKTEIEPKLIIEFDNQNGEIITANLINNGKIAKIIKIVENDPNDFIIDFPFQYIGDGKEKQIFFKYKNASERSENTILNFTIIYEDIDKKIKSKNFNFKDVEHIISEKYKNQIGA